LFLLTHGRAILTTFSLEFIDWEAIRGDWEVIENKH
jgi:hypothetical protein